MRCDFDVGRDPFGSSMGNIDLFWGFVGCIGGVDFGENFSNLVKKSVVLINLERISICILIFLMSLDCALIQSGKGTFAYLLQKFYVLRAGSALTKFQKSMRRSWVV